MYGHTYHSSGVCFFSVVSFPGSHQFCTQALIQLFGACSMKLMRAWERGYIQASKLMSQCRARRLRLVLPRLFSILFTYTCTHTHIHIHTHAHSHTHSDQLAEQTDERTDVGRRGCDRWAGAHSPAVIIGHPFNHPALPSSLSPPTAPTLASHWNPFTPEGQP